MMQSLNNSTYSSRLFIPSPLFLSSLPVSSATLPSPRGTHTIMMPPSLNFKPQAHVLNLDNASPTSTPTSTLSLLSLTSSPTSTPSLSSLFSSSFMSSSNASSARGISTTPSAATPSSPPVSPAGSPRTSTIFKNSTILSKDDEAAEERMHQLLEACTKELQKNNLTNNYSIKTEKQSLLNNNNNKKEKRASHKRRAGSNDDSQRSSNKKRKTSLPSTPSPRLITPSSSRRGSKQVPIDTLFELRHYNGLLPTLPLTL